MQHEQNPLTPAQRELEEALRSIAPTAAGIDPVAAAFAAGRHSARFQVHLWRSAAAILLLIGVIAALMPSMRAAQAPAPLAVQTHAPAAATLSSQSMLALQQGVREKGLAGLAPVHVPPHVLVGDECRRRG